MVDAKLREGVRDGLEGLGWLTGASEGRSGRGQVQRAKKIGAGRQLHLLRCTDGVSTGRKVDPGDEVQPAVGCGQGGKAGGAVVGKRGRHAASNVIFRRRNWVALFET
jgi:hypothetical protein